MGGVINNAPLKKMNVESKKIFYFQWLIIAVFSILIILLIHQNLNLKKPHQVEKSNNCNALLFVSKLNEHLLFKTFPISIKPDDFFFYEKDRIENVNGYLIMVFDLTVCGRCLDDQLRLLNAYKDMLQSRGISLLGIVGIINKSEESEIISRHRTGTIRFPFKFIDVDKLYEIFGISKENFIDTPFYFYTSHNFEILSIFKPEYMETGRFEKWLDTITAQDVF